MDRAFGIPLHPFLQTLCHRYEHAADSRQPVGVARPLRPESSLLTQVFREVVAIYAMPSAQGQKQKLCVNGWRRVQTHSSAVESRRRPSMLAPSHRRSAADLSAPRPRSRSHRDRRRPDACGQTSQLPRAAPGSTCRSSRSRSLLPSPILLAPLLGSNPEGASRNLASCAYRMRTRALAARGQCGTSPEKGAGR